MSSSGTSRNPKWVVRPLLLDASGVTGFEVVLEADVDVAGDEDDDTYLVETEQGNLPHCRNAWVLLRSA